MVEALIENNIPFQALDLENVVKYAKGETYFRVNEYNKNFFRYEHSRDERKYFKYIIWDELKIPKWKK